MSSELRPKLVVSVLIFKDGNVLLGKRCGDPNSNGMYGTPGGHVENLETFSDCARREIAEEVGIEVENLRVATVSNVRQFAPMHFVVISMMADWKSGEPRTLEPDRCEGWEWFDLNNPPAALTPATYDVLESVKTGQVIFERDMK